MRLVFAVFFNCGNITDSIYRDGRAGGGGVGVRDEWGAIGRLNQTFKHKW